MNIQQFPQVKRPDNIEEVIFDNNITSTQMSSGPPKTRKRFTNDQTGLKLTWTDLNDTDYTCLRQQFASMYRIPLEFTHYENGEKYLVSIVDENTPTITASGGTTIYSYCVRIKIINEMPTPVVV